MNIQTNCVYSHLHDSKKKIIIEQGGTRSGKTHNIVLWMINTILSYEGLTFSIGRKELRTVRYTVLKDFISILSMMGLYDENRLNKTDLVYRFENGSELDFFGLDNNEKVKGRKRNLLFINEATQISYSDYKQLAFRTGDQSKYDFFPYNGRIILDYNPNDNSSFIYDYLIPDSRSDTFITTYKDNLNFLSQDIIEEIERLKEEDYNSWLIFGLGRRGQQRDLIYHKIGYIDEIEAPPRSIVLYGIDFGFNAPTCVLKLWVFEDTIYVRELFYKRKSTNSDLIVFLKTIKIEKNAYLYCDSAEPNRIEELTRAGIRALPANKKGKVKDGIDFLQRFTILSLKDNINFNKEIKIYAWQKDKDNNILEADQPVKFMDHAMDALRYAIFSYFKDNNYSKVNIKDHIRMLDNSNKMTPKTFIDDYIGLGEE